MDLIVYRYSNTNMKCTINLSNLNIDKIVNYWRTLTLLLFLSQVGC